MPPRKLQVPVKIKKQRRKPKLRQRIVVKTNIRNMPYIKMPEISGITGGIGVTASTGLDGAGGVGFSMPEIEVFGVRSKGEKVFIALDSDALIMRDEVGGMRAYTIIKEELARIIEGLSPTTLFNLAVYDHHSVTVLFSRNPRERGQGGYSKHAQKWRWGEGPACFGTVFQNKYSLRPFAAGTWGRDGFWSCNPGNHRNL